MAQNIPPTEVLKTLIGRVPDLAGLLIALVILFTIYQAQHDDFLALQENYIQLARDCTITLR